MTQPITPEMSIPEILKQYPQTQGVFEKFGLKAEGYKALDYENLAATAKVHQIDLETLVAALNQCL